jgi:hypothetical protein
VRRSSIAGGTSGQRGVDDADPGQLKSLGAKAGKPSRLKDLASSNSREPTRRQADVGTWPLLAPPGAGVARGISFDEGEVNRQGEMAGLFGQSLAI